MSKYMTAKEKAAIIRRDMLEHDRAKAIVYIREHKKSQLGAN